MSDEAARQIKCAMDNITPWNPLQLLDDEVYSHCVANAAIWKMIFNG